MQGSEGIHVDVLAACGYVREGRREVGEPAVAFRVQTGRRSHYQDLDAHLCCTVEDVREIEPAACSRDLKIEVPVRQSDEQAVLGGLRKAPPGFLDPAPGQRLGAFTGSSQAVGLKGGVVRCGTRQDPPEPTECTRVTESCEKLVSHCGEPYPAMFH